MRVLLACEESQEVTKRLRAKGIEAFSCDLQPGAINPAWHYQQDVVPLLTQQWDMIIAFPPCTHLAVSGTRWFKQKQADGRQQQGIDFFNLFTNLSCPKVVIENPVGIMSTQFRKPDQIIQPYEFGDEASKKTCLWLKGVPKLVGTKLVGKGESITLPSGGTMPKWYSDAWNLSPAERSKVRSKTFPGIADAMASQWGDLLIEELS